MSKDDYLAFCADTNTEPEKPFKGVFNVRLTPEKHKQAAMGAAYEGISLNRFVSEAVDEKLDRRVLR